MMWNPTSYLFDLLAISTNLRGQANQANQTNELSIPIAIDLWHLSQGSLIVASLILLQCLRLGLGRPNVALRSHSDI